MISSIERHKACSHASSGQGPWSYSDLTATTGRIFDIQRYSIHDGPGIRSIVFLKGCRFRCQWCCNPESQSREIETMLRCGKAKTIGQDVTVAEVMEEVMRDQSYYRQSGGGITLSGGETLKQPDFASALLQVSKLNGINTAIETTGDADIQLIKKKILPHLDLLLLDIKHTNSAKHEAFTGVPNENLLENARQIAATGQKTIIRIPVVPTFNDTEDEIAATARFVQSLPNVNEIHLLPYHPYGTDKYAGLSRSYKLPHIKAPSTTQMEKLKAVVELHGLVARIGG